MEEIREEGGERERRKTVRAESVQDEGGQLC